MPTPEDKTDGEKKLSGRVRHDAGGRAIWEWAVESGRHAIDSTSRLLKKLNLSDLSLVGDDEAPGKGKGESGSPPLGDKQPAAARPEWVPGFDPYNSRSPARATAPPRPKAPARPPIARSAAPVKPAGFFARLFGRR
ncbi:MAG: hypothetical protein ABW278_06940 [Steroidobacteraceae bacterium]